MKRHERERLIKALEHFDRYSGEYDIPNNTKERATEIFRKAVSSTDILDGRGVETVAATSMLLAARESSTILDADQLADVSSGHIQSERLHQTSKQLRKELDLGMLLANPHKKVDHIASELDINDAFTEHAHECVDALLEKGVTSGHKSGGVAGAVIYLLSLARHDQAFTQYEISNVADVSTVTIRNRYQEYWEPLSEDGFIGEQKRGSVYKS